MGAKSRCKLRRLRAPDLNLLLLILAEVPGFEQARHSGRSTGLLSAIDKLFGISDHYLERRELLV